MSFMRKDGNELCLGRTKCFGWPPELWEIVPHKVTLEKYYFLENCGGVRISFGAFDTASDSTTGDFIKKYCGQMSPYSRGAKLTYFSSSDWSCIQVPMKNFQDILID